MLHGLPLRARYCFLDVVFSHTWPFTCLVLSLPVQSESYSRKSDAPPLLEDFSFQCLFEC